MSGPLGAVLAGGESRRYGSPKALARVGGMAIIERVAAALDRVAGRVVILANEPDLFTHLGLPIRPDIRPGLGALGGIHAGLAWAREEGRPGILAVACDMPFPCEALLARLRDVAFGDGEPAPAVVAIPESRGRRGVEPLFAAYGAGCVPAIEARIDAGDHRVVGFHEDVEVRRIGLPEVERLCDPERAFLNVNTTADRDRAERLAAGDAA